MNERIEIKFIIVLLDLLHAHIQFKAACVCCIINKLKQIDDLNAGQMFEIFVFPPVHREMK